MQIKKFEAPTIQEALETIKRELGPEAIILQTKQHKRGFGLMSKASVEVTAAVSDRAIQKKKVAESRLNEPARTHLERLPANRQAEFYDSVLDKSLERAARSTRDRVQLSTAGPRAASPARTTVPAAASAAPEQPPIARRPGEVRYADIDDEAAAVGNSPDRRLSGAEPAGRARSIAQAALPRGASGMEVEEELRHLKRMIEEMKVNQEQELPATGAHALGTAAAGTLATPALQDAFEQLVINGVDRRIALGLMKQVGFELGDGARAQNPEEVLDRLASAILATTQVASPLASVKARTRDPQTGSLSGEGPAVFAVVGPTGVGKTTTVAKMASDALLKRGLRVGLINLDCYKVAAVDQLATYAKILKAPFRSVTNGEELRAAMQDFASLDVVLIDTTGRSQRDPQALNEMEGLLSTIPGIQSQLILAATTRDAELYDMTARFAVFKPQGLLFSKLDEAMIYGAIYNVSQKSKLPLLYFTTGQRVPEDFEEASRERVVSLVMDL